MKRLMVIVAVLVAPGVCRAGDFRSQAAVDFLYAESRDGQPTDGISERLAAQEIGMRIRFDVREFDQRLKVAVDYRGREPVSGDIQNSTLRLLYQGELSYALIKNELTVAVGRFVAPAALLLPVDGVRLDYSPINRLTISAFGGHRAISISRRNLGFGRLYPAVGAAVRFADTWLTAEVAGAYSEDQAILVKGSADESQELAEDYGAGNLYARVMLRPISQLILGAQTSFLEQARYILGPTWSAVELDVDTFNIWSANLFGDWRPLKQLQVDYTFHYQQATAYRAGLRLDGSTDLGGDQAPVFIDNRLRLGWRPFNLGWIRAWGRLRLRPDRQERRIGVSIRADRLGLAGLYIDGRVRYEDVEFDSDVDDPPDLDRLRWSAALGYRNYGIDARAGARLVERFGSPVSGRQFDPRQGDQPDSIVDLSPFTLETQRVLFVRAFYAIEVFFAGLDFERNLEDNEFRFMLQAGAFLETSW